MEQTKNKKIIIEGLWHIGKSNLAKYLARHHSYEILTEPDHLIHKVPNDQASKWYIDVHTKRLNELYKNSDTPMVMERSILASAAFASAAKQQESPELKLALEKFGLLYKKHKPLVIFLYDDAWPTPGHKNQIQDTAVLNALEDQDFAVRYLAFFRTILPFSHDITPVCINVSRDGTLRPTTEIAGDILAVLQHNRLAQVNVACYKGLSNPLFLLLKRNAKKGGFWQVVTGGVKLHQALSEAVLAELDEELGITASRNAILSTSYSFNYIGGEGYELNEYVFGYKLSGSDSIKLSDEHTEFAFLPLEEAVPMLKYESNKTALKKVYAKIKKHS